MQIRVKQFGYYKAKSTKIKQNYPRLYNTLYNMLPDIFVYYRIYSP